MCELSGGIYWPQLHMRGSVLLLVFVPVGSEGLGVVSRILHAVDTTLQFILVASSESLLLVRDEAVSKFEACFRTI